ncbi:MAG: lysophospholipid acyltransferase family protein [Pseudomonadota bacterium]|nr:lysophospholipid acyltransferase family protein [Pseudomonadota bacterium]
MAIKQILTVSARITLTAYCFLQFAAQVLWLGKWQMPRVMDENKSSPDARRNALHIAHRHVVRYLSTLDFLGLVELRFEGKPHHQPSILVANHPSLLDFIVLLRDLPNAVCLYKSRSLDSPVLSAFIQVAGYIEGMDGGASASANKRIISSCCERLEEGHHVVIFPEGTRSESASSAHKFRTTAFHAAVKCPAPIQPVVIFCQPLFLGKDQSWIEFSRHRNIMTIRYLPVMRVEDLPKSRQTATGLAHAVRQNILNALAEMSTEKRPTPLRGNQSNQ